MTTTTDADPDDEATEETVASTDDPARAEQADADADADDDTAHLRDLSDGAGCTEIWEHLSETRD